MATTTLPPRERLLNTAPEPDFDLLESACQRAGYSQAHPFAGLGLHSDDSLKGRLSLAAFIGFYKAYVWFTALGSRRSRR